MNDPLFRKRSRPAGKLAEVVASKIERDVIDRDWPVGTVLGSEAALTQRYGVAKGTAEKAFGVLREEGLVVTVPGRGIYVIDR